MNLSEYEKLVVQHGVAGMYRQLELELQVPNVGDYNAAEGWCEWEGHGRYRSQWLGARSESHQEFCWAWAHPAYQAGLAGTTEVERLRALGFDPFSQPKIAAKDIGPVELAVVAGELAGATAVCFMDEMAFAIYDFPLQLGVQCVSGMSTHLDHMGDELPSLKDRTRLRAAFQLGGWKVEEDEQRLAARHPDGTVFHYEFDEHGEIVHSWTERASAVQVDTWVKQAEELIEANSLDEAEALLMKARDAQPKHYEMNMTLSALARKRKDWEQAHRWLRQAHRHHPDKTLPLYWLALASEKLEDWPKALDFIQKYLVSHPQDPYSLALLGRCLGATGKLPEAIAALSHSLRLRPSDFNYYLLAKLQQQAGDLPQALASVAEAIMGDDNYAPYWNLRGILLQALGQREKAREAYQRAVKIDPKSLAGTHLEALGQS